MSSSRDPHADPRRDPPRDPRRDPPAGPVPAAVPHPDDEPGPHGLTWGQWRRIAALLPPVPRRGRRPRTNLLAVLGAVLHRRRTRCPWRALPPRFPPWRTVYGYYHRWLTNGTWRAIREIVEETPLEDTPPGDG